MTLDEDECWARLGAARHGVLATVHPERGVDAVPVVFAVAGRRIVLPVDTVKPKAGGRLARVANIGRDPRCVLLVDHYTDDWEGLWWVRVHGRGRLAEPASHTSLLGERYPQYRAPGSIAAVIELTPTAITGWAGRSRRGSPPAGA